MFFYCCEYLSEQNIYVKLFPIVAHLMYVWLSKGLWINDCWLWEIDYSYGQKVYTLNIVYNSTFLITAPLALEPVRNTITLKTIIFHHHR